MSRLFAIILVASLLTAACASASAGSIRLNPRSSVNGASILLGEVAQLEGFSEAEEKKIAALSLGASPPPAQKIRLNKSQVKTRLYNAGIDLDGHKLVIPDQVSIERAARVVKGEEIIDAAAAYLNDNLPQLKKTFKVVVKETPADIILPVGEVEFRPILDVRPEKVGLQGFRVEVVQGGVVKRVVGMTSAIDVEVEVATAARRIGAGETLTEADIVMGSERVSRLRGDALYAAEDAVGRRTTKMITSGAVITRSSIEVIPDVNVGDIINLMFESGAVVVSTRGRALEKGVRGDTIKVMNLGTKKVMSAEIIDPVNARVLLTP